MTIRRALCALSLVLGLAAVSIAARYVQKEVPEVPGAPKALNAGGVQGTIGRIGTWVQEPSSDTNATTQRSFGEYGGLWDGQQYQMVPPQSDVHFDIIHHRYEKVSGSPYNKYVSMGVISTPEFDGNAQIHQPLQSPSWWWTCSCQTYQQPPSMRYRVGADWITPPLDPDNDPSNDTGHSNGGEFDSTDVVDDDVPGNANYPVPANHPHYPPNSMKSPGNPTTHSQPTNYPESENGYANNDIHGTPLGGGDYFAVTAEKLPGGATEVEISLRLDVNATVSVDNAKVNGWKSALKINFFTETLVQKP